MPPNPSTQAWEQPPIADYGFLSDCHSAVLVDRGGSIDWWCAPRFDSPSLFGRLLDPDAGHWTICPVEPFTTTRSYVGDTLVLGTRFATASGEVLLTDAAGLAVDARGHDIGLRSPHVLLREVEGIRGQVEMMVRFAPRMEYGRTQPHLQPVTGGVVARGGPAQVTLSSPVPLAVVGDGAEGTFTVGPREVVAFAASHASSFGTDPDLHPTASIEDTVAGWESWSALHHSYTGGHPELVRRSSLVLQGLTFQPSGAVIAAATTSLPEAMGGALNWDYRYAWLRDLSLTMRSLWIAACPDEPARVLDWFVNAAGHVGDELFQIMYGVEGERDLTEHTLEHLAGYRGSRPVRIGNEAWTQTQLDVLGEVLDAVHLLKDDLGDLDEQMQALLVALADRAAATWTEPDAGMWEARDAQRHYVSSKVMCWVALDRAISLADRLGPGAHVEAWTAAREDVRAAVMEQGWDRSANAYTGAFGSSDLDASVLLMPLVGFLPADHPRMRATIAAIADQLGSAGLIRRWPSDPSGFLICTFWLAECLALGGQVDEAEQWFASAAGYANDLGLMSEEAEPGGRLLGNFPQAFSHVGLINAAWRISEASSAADPTSDPPHPNQRQDTP